MIALQRAITAAGAELDGVLELIATASQRLTGADGATVSLIDGDELVVRAASGSCARLRGDRRPTAPARLGQPDATTDPILVAPCGEDAMAGPEHPSWLGGPSVIGLPLSVAGRVIGSLQVASTSQQVRLGADERAILELVAAIASAGIGNAERHEAERSEIAALGRYETIFKQASIGIARIGADGCALSVNPALEAMLGYSAAELAELSFTAYTHPRHLRAERELFAALMVGDSDHYQIEKRFIKKNGEAIWAHLTVCLERSSDGAPIAAIAMIENVTERHAAEEALRCQSEINRYQAQHDSLTGLPNRVLFREWIARAIDAHAERGEWGERCAVLLMDLDRFKDINDSLGHHTGDGVLSHVASRLERAVAQAGMVARLGGDEFAVLLERVVDRTSVLDLIGAIQAALGQPVMMQGLPIALEASIGVSLYPDDGGDVDTLLQHADIAMYQAKANETGCAFYDPREDANDSAHLTLAAELRRAITERELVVHYQPKVKISSNHTSSVEALVRWQHPSEGLVFPDHFIPIAQHSELIKPLTLYVIEESLAQCARWRAEGLDVSVSVNLSTRNLLDLEFPLQVAELLERAAMPPASLMFEITESVMMAERTRIGAVLAELDAMGLRLSIDDFGTGYSSLVHLRRLPLREVKIDRSFVATMHEDPDDAAIVRSMIELGRSLGLDVVAEGVEREETLDELAALGCGYAQGYLLSPPASGDELSAWLRPEPAPVALLPVIGTAVVQNAAPDAAEATRCAEGAG
ncbi:MAG: EAL domain-containing protein [Actinomycetota bacterium]|nr:EAL domain-containing protein [Actinomycetota bacterium]